MSDVNAFIALLMRSRTDTHYLHLQTKSYAHHKALGKYYEGIGELIDNYAEAYMARHARIKPVILNKRSPANSKKISMYFENLLKRVEAMNLPKDSSLRNIQDDIYTLIYKTLYLITLK